MDHLIEYTTADPCFGLLPVPGAGGQLWPQNALVTRHAGFGQTAFMIPSVPFPSFTPQVQDRLYPLIARFNMSIAPLGFTRAGIVLGWNHRFDGRRPGLGGIGQQSMDFPPIIAPSP